MGIPVIDLFAGPGGLNEGFSQLRDSAGNRVFNTVISVEFEKFAHCTLELRALFRKLQDDGKAADYFEYAKGELERETLFETHKAAGAAAKKEALLAELGKSPADDREIEDRIRQAIDRAGKKEFVLIGGPPCQAYSLVGRARRTNDLTFSRDHKHYLYREYLRIVEKFRPAIFVMENVPGLLSAKNRGERMFELICDDLEKAGYTLHPVSPERAELQPDDPRKYVVRAEEHGVPQSRARVFIMGLRSDLRLKPALLKRLSGDPISVQEVLGDLPRIRSRLSKQPDSVENWRSAIRRLREYQFHNLRDNFRSELLRRLEILPTSYKLGERAMPMTGRKPTRLAGWYLDSECDRVLNHNSRGHMASDLMRYFFWSQYAESHGSSPSLHDVPHFLRPKHLNVFGDLADLPFSDRFRVQLANKPSTTVVSHIAKDGHYYIHYEPKQCRSLSVREAARLQTFPDNYFFEGAATDQYRQVGNAVPPYLAKQLAALVHGVLTGDRESAKR